MTALYLESSAVLAWLFDEPGGERIASRIEGATSIAASALTQLEVERAIVREVVLRRRTEAEAAKLHGLIRREAAHWDVKSLEDEVLERAGRPFPLEPVRALDAIHLATALELLTAYPDLEVLTLDARIAENARALGLPLAT